MSEVGCLEMQHFLQQIKQDTTPGVDFHIKPLIQRACANMFSQYMCSTRFDYDDQGFQNITKCFDDIFWEINQGKLCHIFITLSKKNFVIVTLFPICILRMAHDILKISISSSN